MKIFSIFTNLFGTSIGRTASTFAAGAGLLLSAAVSVATTPADHQAEQPEPIQLGSTGGNINDSSNLYCCGGTLGALVTDGTFQYVLSNNHVLARSNLATLGEGIIHPGLIDQNPTCGKAGEDTVASLMNFVPLKFKQGKNVPLNEVDAAIAQVVSGSVSPDGAILSIGPLSGKIVAPFVGQAVQKSGRTTGHTAGTVSALAVTVDVGYSKECGGASNQVARFTGQIRITDGDFSAGGDSGSVVVEGGGSADPETGLPRALGLLYAGSSSSTIANPMDRVLALLDVSMAAGAAVPTGTVTGLVTDAQVATPIAGATVTADTGQSTTSGANGAYTIANVPEGERTVTAKANGYAAQTLPVTVTEAASSEVNFALAEATEPAQSIVQCIVYDTSGGKGNSRDLLISSLIVDDLGNPVSGAEVRIDVTKDGALLGSGSGAITDSSGKATYKIRSAGNGSYSTVVTAVISSLVFEGSTPANEFRKGTDPAPDSDCRDDAPQPSSGIAAAAPAGANAKRADVEHAIRIKTSNEARLFATDDVVGTGVSISHVGDPVIEVYLRRDSSDTRAKIPAAVENVPTRVVVTGPFEAY